MTLLEPEMLMMAVQSGNPLISCKSHLLYLSFKRLGMCVLGMDRDREGGRQSISCLEKVQHFQVFIALKKTFSLIASGGSYSDIAH